MTDTLLFHAVTTGDVSQAARLLRSSADVNTKNANELTTLHVAASQGMASMLDILLCYGPDISAKTLDSVGGSTALHLGVASRNPQVVKILLKGNANPSIQDVHGFTPLHLAARQGDGQIVQDLLAVGADATIADKQGKTAYYWAKEYGHASVMELLPVFQYDPLEQFEKYKLTNPVPVPPSASGGKKKSGGGGKDKKGKKKK